MWLTTLCLLVAAEGSAEEAASTPLPAPAAEQRTLSEISLDLQQYLKAEATAKTGAERQTAILTLTQLYREMMLHPQREEHSFLKNMRGQLYNRLVRVRDDLQRQIAREQRQAKPQHSDEAEPNDEELNALRYSLATSLATSDQALGSPTLMFARGGGTITDENGQALVELIERTINPAFWSTNGGTGQIIYYAPLQCLVVAATGPVQEEIGGFLNGVRAAGQ